MGVSKIFFAALLLVLTISAVNAYTVVMRDGRRVEIPNDFNVTDSTLTYQVSNGFQITIQLNTVDIAATERANGDAQGSFLRRGNAPVEPASQVRRVGSERSITNADLEKYRRARVEGEREYEDRARDLGLPSMEDRRREVAAIEDRTVEQVRSMRAQEEAYWRSRAEALRAEMAAKELQFGTLRQQPDWFYSSVGAFPGFLDGVGFGVTGGRFNRFGRFSSSPFDGFLATPITPFPRFPGFSRRPVFRAPGVHFNPRPSHGRHGSRR
jgi:hypothetical protein